MSTAKVALHWAGALLIAVILVVLSLVAQSTAQQDHRTNDMFIACVQAGNPPGDCSLAVRPRK